MSKAGRPTKYDPSILENVEKLAGVGLTNKDIAYFLDIDETTLYDWKKKYPEFSQSLKKGKLIGKINIINTLYKKAIDGNLTAMIFWLVNRYPEEWKNIQRMEHTITSIPPIKYVPVKKEWKAKS